MPNGKQSPQKTQLALAKEVETLTKDLRKLTKEIERLHHLEFVKILNKPGRMMWLSFLKGALMGFGTVVGAAILIALFVFIISKVSLVPVLGDFIQDLMQEVNLDNLTQ